MMIFDAHLDLAFNAVEWNRDLRMDVYELRAREQNLGLAEPGRGTGTVTFPELRKGQIRLGVGTLFARYEPSMAHSIGYCTPEACFAAAHAQLAYYRAMESLGEVTLIRTRTQLDTHLAQALVQPAEVPFGLILSMECADAILSPGSLAEWYASGLRVLGLTHYGANRYGGGTNSELGLTLEALPLMKEMERLGIALDLTHLSDRSFDHVRRTFGGRVLASHQNARKFCPWQRQFSDDQIRYVIERQGVLGMAYDAIMLQPKWVRGVTKPAITQERIVDNLDHICQLAGNCRHVGIGSDLDGGYGTEQMPTDVDTIADLQNLRPLLEKRGYSEADIASIFHGNWIRFFQEILTDSSGLA